MTRIAVLDDWQGVAHESADWSRLEARADVAFFERPFDGPDSAARALGEFDVIMIMRERTAFPAALLERLMRLRMIALTGSRTWTLDVEACTARGIVVCNTGGEKSSRRYSRAGSGLVAGRHAIHSRGRCGHTCGWLSKRRSHRDRAGGTNLRRHRARKDRHPDGSLWASAGNAGARLEPESNLG